MIEGRASSPRRSSARGVSARARVLAAAVVVFSAIALGAVSFAQNWSVVRDLSWPGPDIQFREAAAAQTILDEGYGPDATYLHEHVWYNPMAAWFAAAASRVSGAAVPLVVARAGPYVNLAAPVSLFVLVAVTVDVFAAIGAVAAFIFLIGTGFPFYYSATYSPWFAPENFGQAVLYLSLAVAYRAWRHDTSAFWCAACGALLGITFLVHTAPAIVGGLTIVSFAALQTRHEGRPRQGLTGIAVALAVAFLVSLPFGFEILWHYHLKIVNQFPSQSPSDLLDLNELPGLLRMLATVPTAVAAAGLAARAARRRDRGVRLLCAWFAAVALLLGAHIARLVLGKAGIHLPAVIPPFHFFFYLMAIAAVGFGIGVRDGSHAAVSWLLQKRRLDVRQAGLLSGTIACVVSLFCVAASYGRYRERVDFTVLRREAVAMNQQYPADLLQWIRLHTSPDDVFLCTDDASLYIVTPAGRKVVATNRYFSNPYVDWASREADRRSMFEALERGDLEKFARLARTYDVRFVVLSRDRSEFWLKAAGLRRSDLPDVEPGALSRLPGFTLAFRTDRFAIARYRNEPEEAARR